MPPTKVYAETSSLRLRQQLQDTETLVWVAAWTIAGRRSTGPSSTCAWRPPAPSEQAAASGGCGRRAPLRSLRIDADDLQLFALRVAARAPLHELRRVTSDPAKALAAGVDAPLAAPELARLGLRQPVTTG